MIHELIKEQHGTIPINKATALLNAPTLPKYKEDDITQQIIDIAEHNPRYGYRRITATLHRKQMIVNHKRVRRIMREKHITCKRKKKYVKTTDSEHSNKTYPNLTQHLAVNKLNQVWPADITYIQLANGDNCYLATILDKCSRKCLGWQLSRNIDTQLCIDALTKALHNRQNTGIIGVIHHSDRGTTYTSKEYVELLEKNGIQISMSRKANPYDNAHAESFFKTIKHEEVYMNEYNSFNEAYENIEHFIEEVYNKKRLHSAIGYMPPAEFEEKILKEVCA